ncbi:MAG TPA: dTDP-glucose 4,6-dehydratase [Verrucomicrobiae bacterium]|jgi:dTDP-glucose 4,6-dehydratase|nr:dTDP-glucose 4,6-dehydratase [Verrucomicrobiae bacterium]
MDGTVIVTGGAGFIGANFVRTLLKQTSWRICVVDKLTYAGNLESLEEVAKDPRYSFVHADITDGEAMEKLFRETRPAGVFNFAAESHVDRSIDSPDDFIQTNVVGTHTLLRVALHYYKELTEAAQKNFRFLHVSTDEVYGSLGATGLFMETTPYAPNSPYSASKAAADHLVRAYYETYKFPGLITNCSNNYGPFQFPEKLIPLTLLNALEGKKLPIYGDGSNVRDWLYVEDHCDGILLAFQKGKLGEKYNIGGNNERTNLQIVDRICEVLESVRPAAKNAALASQGMKRYADLKTFVRDRPGHDKRYAIDASKISKELGWKAKHPFDKGIVETIQWYLANGAWCEKVQSGKYGRERLGGEAPKKESMKRHS